MNRIAVIGTGYVGLTTGVCFAHLGHDVVCADIDPSKVERLQRGEVPIVEAGLQELLADALRSDRIRFVLGAVNAVADREFVYLCVPTPQGADGGTDLSYIEAAVHEIAAALPAEAIVVNKSTVPVGSTKIVERALGRPDVSVVSNPEFLREGSAVHDFLHPDRIVIGSDDQAAAIKVASLYLGVPAPLVVTDPSSAETIKYAANAFLATKLSFVNAVAAVCEAVGADVNDVVLGLGYDKRIGQDFLKPGPGWGGSCFLPDDTVLARRGATALLSFRELFDRVEQDGADSWEVLAWRVGEPTPTFERVAAFTSRPYDGVVVDIRTKMGRRLTVTADHPMVTSDGVDGDAVDVKAANALTPMDWLPIATGYPVVADESDSRLVRNGAAKCPPAGQVNAPLPLGRDLARSMTSSVPDEIWSAPPSAKQALVQDLWDQDGGSCRRLADGLVRLLCDLDVMTDIDATPDGYRVAVSDADATGYRRLSKNAAWVRVTSTTPHRYNGTVYSLEVDGAHTVVTSFGLVAHNCFPKDTRALVKIASDAGYDFNLLRGVISVNDQQHQRVADKIEAAAGGSLDGQVVAVWGLTFKARTDDLRDSPSLAICDELVKRGAKVRAFDPTVRRQLPNIDVRDDPYDACDGAAVLTVLTEWDEFRWLDMERVGDLMTQRAVVDARNLLDRAALMRAGFRYQGIGRQ